MPDKSISPRTRRRLWAYSDNTCEFTGCDQALVEKTRAATDDTVIGVECHIVAQKDSRTVARAPCLLSPEELQKYAHLVEDRHSFQNLVLMCGNHATVIDNVAEGYSVAQVIEMKRTHEQAVIADRRARRVSATSSGGTAAKSPEGAVRLLVLDDVPAWERKAVTRLAKKCPADLEWLRSQVGEPAETDRVLDLIRRWPERLANGSFDVRHALARQAEGLGLWTAAADVWEHIAAAEKGEVRADRLTAAAIDAKMGGDNERASRLMNIAETVDPDSARLRLARLNEAELIRAPVEQLEQLEALQTTDAPLAGLIAAQKARAAMLIPDVALADKYVAEAESLDPDSIPAKIMRVNLQVQRARIALHEDRDFSLAETELAMSDALALRDVLMGMARWEESGRLLMLAADVPALSRDLDGARKLLERARPEELEAPEGAEVLGEAALRDAAPELSLAMTANAGATDAIRRIRASATIDFLNRPDAESLDELEELALGEGPESEAAAFARLVACLPPVKAPWNDDVAHAIEDQGAQRLVSSVHIMHLAAIGRLLEAEEVADVLPDTIWAAEIRLRVAGVRGGTSVVKRAADKFLEFGPDASGRLLAAKAFGRAGELERSGQLFATIANESNVSPVLRSEGYAGLLQTLADRDEWERAAREWEAWQQFGHRKLSRPDDRISAWQVRIAHHSTGAS
jgi:hypothetical protein